MRIPADSYFCVQSRILAEPFDNTYACRYFPDSRLPRLVVAGEYEDNFLDFKDRVYEVQILM